MASEIYHSPYINTLRATAWWLYVFHAVCFLLTLGMLSFIPLILNYLARPKAVNTFVYTHHTWQIRSFWWYFIWGALGWNPVLYPDRHSRRFHHLGTGLGMVCLADHQGIPESERQYPHALSRKLTLRKKGTTGKNSFYGQHPVGIPAMPDNIRSFRSALFSRTFCFRQIATLFLVRFFRYA